MKNVLVIALLLVGFGLQAQPTQHQKRERSQIHEKMKDFTPQQRAELKTKRMVLTLNLDENQQREMLKLHTELENMRAQKQANKENRKDLTSNELFALTASRLDKKIATQKKIKSILTDEQFEKFLEERQGRDKHKRGRQQRHGR